MDPILLEYGFKNIEKHYYFKVEEDVPAEEEFNPLEGWNPSFFTYDLNAYFKKNLSKCWVSLNLYQQETDFELAQDVNENLMFDNKEIQIRTNATIKVYSECVKEKLPFQKAAPKRSKSLIPHKYKYGPTEDQESNLQFARALQLGVGKILNTFLKDAYVPIAVMRNGTQAYNEGAEQNIRSMLGYYTIGTHFTLKGVGSPKKTILNLLKATKRSRSRESKRRRV